MLMGPYVLHAAVPLHLAIHWCSVSCLTQCCLSENCTIEKYITSATSSDIKTYGVVSYIDVRKIFTRIQ